MKSIVSYPERGEGGRNSYRGNCSPRIIEDIIEQYQIHSLSDYMVGSGTTEDVCKKAGVAGTFLDLNRGFDMLTMDIPERPENVFWHPPYDDIVVYSDEMYKAQSIIDKYGFDPRINDLSRCNGWEDFVRKMNYCCMKQFTAMEKGGRMFILMGDIKKKGKLYSMLLDIAKPGTVEQIIIKAQHNCVSDSRSYAGRFVPIVHEYLLVLRKDSPLIFNIQMAKNVEGDMRDFKGSTWRDIVAAILEDAAKPMSLSEIYAKVDGHRRCTMNPHWKDKIRQVLQSFDIFTNVGRGVYKIA